MQTIMERLTGEVPLLSDIIASMNTVGTTYPENGFGGPRPFQEMDWLEPHDVWYYLKEAQGRRENIKLYNMNNRKEPFERSYFVAGSKGEQYQNINERDFVEILEAWLASSTGGEKIPIIVDDGISSYLVMDYLPERRELVIGDPHSGMSTTLASAAGASPDDLLYRIPLTTFFRETKNTRFGGNLILVVNDAWQGTSAGLQGFSEPTISSMPGSNGALPPSMDVYTPSMPGANGAGLPPNMDFYTQCSELGRLINTGSMVMVDPACMAEMEAASEVMQPGGQGRRPCPAEGAGGWEGPSDYCLGGDLYTCNYAGQSDPILKEVCSVCIAGRGPDQCNKLGSVSDPDYVRPTNGPAEFFGWGQTPSFSWDGQNFNDYNLQQDTQRPPYGAPQSQQYPPYDPPYNQQPPPFNQQPPPYNQQPPPYNNLPQNSYQQQQQNSYANPQNPQIPTYSQQQYPQYNNMRPQQPQSSSNYNPQYNPSPPYFQQPQQQQYQTPQYQPPQYSYSAPYPSTNQLPYGEQSQQQYQRPQYNAWPALV
jgi:hypothetical protein